MKNSGFKKWALMLMVLTMTATLFTAQKAAAQAKLVTIKSAKGFDETVETIKKSVAGSGMMVLSEINHGKILSMTGLSIKAESIFIGNPNVGKDAFSDNPAVGLAIPIRLNIYEENGATYVNYFAPSSELNAFKGAKIKMIGQEMDKKLKMLTGMLGM
jgi:uncharacterized protein (DUF302 family)